jgi:polyhydroxyalkanoate synthesis repressor PhaR
MEAARIIKKYPNRRLYDTVLSRYVTLDEVKVLILTNVAFKIIDENALDMTNYVLLQILAQEENSKPPLLTKEILQSLIRFYGHPLQKTLTQFLARGITLFNAEQASFQESLSIVADEDEFLNRITTASQRNTDIWQSALAEFTDTEKHSEPEG